MDKRKYKKSDKDVRSALGLASNFEKDSLENFVPTRRGPNSSKRDSIDLILIKNTLNEAQRKKSKVEKLIIQ